MSSTIIALTVLNIILTVCFIKNYDKVDTLLKNRYYHNAERNFIFISWLIIFICPFHFSDKVTIGIYIANWMYCCLAIGLELIEIKVDIIKDEVLKEKLNKK